MLAERQRWVVRVAAIAFDLDDWRLWGLLAVLEAERPTSPAVVRELRDAIRAAAPDRREPPPLRVLRALAERIAEAERPPLDW